MKKKKNTNGSTKSDLEFKVWNGRAYGAYTVVGMWIYVRAERDAES